MDMITLAMAKGYTDSQRLGYTETTTKVLIAETEVVGNDVFPEYRSLTAGKTYKVIMDDKAYTLVAISAEGIVVLMNEEEAWAVGDTGEQLVLDGDSGHTYKVAIYEETETIHTIDPKYLPNPADLPSDWIADLKAALGI